MTLKPHERLIIAREEAGFKSAHAASKAHGWPARTYLRHETGEEGFRHVAAKYAQAFNISVEELYGAGKLPIIDLSDFSAWITLVRGGLIDRITTNHPLDCGYRSFYAINPDKAMSVFDNAIKPGALLAFDPDQKPKHGDFVLAHVMGEQMPIFRSYARGDKEKQFRLLPLNSSYSAHTITGPNDGQILGTLIFITYPVNIL